MPHPMSVSEWKVTGKWFSWSCDHFSEMSVLALIGLSSSGGGGSDEHPTAVQTAAIPRTTAAFRR